MVKLASSPYGIWLYSYIKHSNSKAQRIKRARGQRLRLDLAERICRWVLASCRMACVATVVPLQLLAHHTACVRGTDVDKPRNLAKSVMVE